MSTSHQDFPLGAKSDSAMTLPLHAEEDHNGNAFPISSSSSSASSSCSSSRMGESSPESLRSLSSLSSLSGERTRSPLDYDMLEVTVVATLATPLEKTPTADDVSAERAQAAAETTESNDNSVSVYLDANSEYHRELWNDNDGRTLALYTSSSGDSGGHQGLDNRWPDSSCPDSDATEIPVDDDDDEEDEEVLFLSVSSDVGLCKSSVTPAGSTDGFSSVTIIVDEGSEVVRAEAPAFDNHVKVLDMCSPSPGSAGFLSPAWEGATTTDGGSEVILAEVEVPSKEDHQPEALASGDHVRIFNQPPGQTVVPPLEGAIGPQDEASKAEFMPPSLPSKAAKTSSQEAGKKSQQAPKVVQRKGGSRPTPSPSKTPTQVSGYI